MPSRNSTVSKTGNKKPKMSKGPQKAAKKKPEITVTKDSQPEDVLHSSWEFLSAYQFFNTFRSYFHLANTFTVEKLEDALLQIDRDPSEEDEQGQSNRESSVTSQSSATPAPTCSAGRLASFMIHIISPLLSARKKGAINESNYQEYLQQLFPHTEKFNESSMLGKIKLLKLIEQTYVETADENFLAAKDEKSPGELRIDPLGSDYEGWIYWYFGDTRLYREIPHPQSSKRGADWMRLTDFTFELVCSTIQEWHNIVKKFQPSNRSSNKELASTLCDIGLEVIGKLEAKEAAQLKQQAKLKRAKQLELLPKKRSRRLEVKQVEEVKRQKMMEEERQQAELEGYERKQKMKEAKELAEENKRELRVQEARLKNNLHDYISSLISKGQGDETRLKELRTLIGTKATMEERIAKIQGWVQLLNGSISCNITHDTIHFVGDTLQASKSVLFKSVIRYYLLTFRNYHLEPTLEAYDELNTVYTKFILDRYDNLDSFCLDLTHVFATFLDNQTLDQAIHMLKLIFAPPLPNNIDK